MVHLAGIYAVCETAGAAGAAGTDTKRGSKCVRRSEYWFLVLSASSRDDYGQCAGVNLTYSASLTQSQVELSPTSIVSTGVLPVFSGCNLAVTWNITLSCGSQQCGGST